MLILQIRAADRLQSVLKITTKMLLLLNNKTGIKRVLLVLLLPIVAKYNKSSRTIFLLVTRFENKNVKNIILETNTKEHKHREIFK